MNKINFDIKKMIRPGCDEFEPYVAGKPVETLRRELGLKKIIKLASNENALGPSKRSISAIKKYANKVFYYPDSNCFELKRAISKKFGMNSSQITIGNGSDELIELIAKTFFHPTDEIVISEKSFVRYQMAGLLMNCRLVTVPMKNYTHNLKAMAEAVNEKTKAVFIANPNNPTGTYNTERELEEFLITVSSKTENAPLVVLDEAYYEFARKEKGYPEFIKYLKNFPNLIILRTFSKIYGLAGLRIGYGFSSEKIIDYIERLRPPFNVNLLGQIAALVSLGDKKQVGRGTALVSTGKKYFYQELDKMNIPHVPSSANFVMIDVSPRKGAEVFNKLLREGVIVRALDEYELPNHIRVTIGLKEENAYFFKSFRKVLGGR